MSIIFTEQDKIFTLHTKDATYQMKVDAYGFLLHLYYGRKTEGNMDYLLQFADRGFSGNPFDVGNDRTYSMDVLPQELPCQGTGDYRSPAVVIKNADGSYGCDFRYRDHRILKGKYELPHLPAVYAGNEEADTLEIDLEDPVTNMRITLLYGSRAFSRSKPSAYPTTIPSWEYHYTERTHCKRRYGENLSEKSAGGMFGFRERSIRSDLFLRPSCDGTQCPETPGGSWRTGD